MKSSSDSANDSMPAATMPGTITYVAPALDERTRDALKQFQIDHDLEPSGELDAPTQAKLREFAEG